MLRAQVAQKPAPRRPAGRVRRPRRPSRDAADASRPRRAEAGRATGDPAAVDPHGRRPRETRRHDAPSRAPAAAPTPTAAPAGAEARGDRASRPPAVGPRASAPTRRRRARDAAAKPRATPRSRGDRRIAPATTASRAPREAPDDPQGGDRPIRPDRRRGRCPDPGAGRRRSPRSAAMIRGPAPHAVLLVGPGGRRQDDARARPRGRAPVHGRRRRDRPCRACRACRLVDARRPPGPPPARAGGPGRQVVIGEPGCPRYRGVRDLIARARPACRSRVAPGSRSSRAPTG